MFNVPEEATIADINGPPMLLCFRCAEYVNELNEVALCDDCATEEIYERPIKLGGIIAIIRQIEAKYPVEVFPAPPAGTSPDCYTAAGVRLACGLIIDELEKDE